MTFLALLKLEGENESELMSKVEGHPVFLKMAHLKTLMERLKPLDSKL